MRYIELPQQEGWHWMYDPQGESWHMTFFDENTENVVLMSSRGNEARRIVPVQTFKGRRCEWWPIPAPTNDDTTVLVDRETLDRAIKEGGRVVVNHIERRYSSATMVDIEAGDPEGPRIDLIVSRHPAAVEFIANEIGGAVVSPRLVSAQHADSIRDILVLESATADDVRGKVVAGNLPLHLAAEAAVVYAIEFDGAPPRGREYTLDDMREAGARLVPYRVDRVQ